MVYVMVAYVLVMIAADCGSLATMRWSCCVLIGNRFCDRLIFLEPHFVGPRFLPLALVRVICRSSLPLVHSHCASLPLAFGFGPCGPGTLRMVLAAGFGPCGG